MTGLNFSRENVAWAAGLFEGEGCVHLQGIKTGLNINMTDEDVVRRVLSVIGLGKINGPYPVPRHPSYKLAWRWDVHGFEKTQALLAAWWPWLGDRRKARAIEVLKITREAEPLPQFKPRCKRGHSFSGENLYINPTRKTRRCRTCAAVHNKRTAARRLAERHEAREREAPCLPE